MSKRVEFRWPDGLLELVDAARGDVARAVWVRRAVEMALDTTEHRIKGYQAAEAIVARPDGYSAMTVDGAKEVLEKPLCERVLEPFRDSRPLVGVDRSSAFRRATQK